MYRVSSFASNNLTLAQALETQARLRESQVRVSSGKTSSDYAGLDSQTHGLLSLKNSHNLITRFIGNIDVTDRRLQSMETNTSAIFDVATEFRTLLINALNADNAGELALNQSAQHMLNQVVGMLNYKEDDRFLFSGSRTDTAPVNLTLFDPDDVSYDPNDPVPTKAGYYDGDNVTLSVRIDESITVSYGVKATESGFEKLLRALELARTTAVAPGAVDTARLDSALTLAIDAIDEIPDIQSRIGASRRALEDTKFRHQEAQLYAEQVIGDIENVDIAEAMTRIAGDQLQLEASYMVTARLASITLLDYLR